MWDLAFFFVVVVDDDDLQDIYGWFFEHKTRDQREFERVDFVLHFSGNFG